MKFRVPPDPIKDALLTIPVQWREAVFAAAKELARQHREGQKVDDSMVFHAAAIRVAWAILEAESRGQWS